MPSIKGTETEKNLLKAFAGESQARNRYTYFSKVARKEGFVQISDIFEETAGHEKVHAMGAPRIHTNIKLGTRTDREQSLEDKVNSVVAKQTT